MSMARDDEQSCNITAPHHSTGGDCQSGDDAFPQVAPADWWQPLTRLAQPAPISVPLWLVLPEGWRQQAVLAHTAERLVYSPAQKYAPGA